VGQVVKSFSGKKEEKFGFSSFFVVGGTHSCTKRKKLFSSVTKSKGVPTKKITGK